MAECYEDMTFGQHKSAFGSFSRSRYCSLLGLELADRILVIESNFPSLRALKDEVADLVFSSVDGQLQAEGANGSTEPLHLR